MAARRYVARHLDTVALMKSMGAPQRLVLADQRARAALIAIVAGLRRRRDRLRCPGRHRVPAADLVRGELPRADARVRAGSAWRRGR